MCILPSITISREEEGALVGFASDLLASSLARQGLLHSSFLARFEIKRMSLDFLNDVFLLDFPFEATQGVFQRLAFLEPDFRQSTHPLAV